MIVFRKTVCSSSTTAPGTQVLALDDEDALAGVTVGIRVVEDVEQVATLHVEDDVLEPDAAIRLELRVRRRVVPGEGLHCYQQ